MELLPLVCLCLLSCSGETSAAGDGQVLRDRTGENIPGAAPRPNIDILHVTKDGILLQCEAHGTPPLTVEWKDSANKTLPADEGKESERGGRSYITVNITVAKSDKYRCVATQKNISHQISAETSVYIQGVKVVVEEDDDAVLSCSPSTKEDITGKAFDWKKDGQKEVFFYNSGIFTSQDQQFTGRVSHFQDQLKNGDASIKIRKTKMADSGNYSCDFPRLQQRQTFIIELVVGAAPRPNIDILYVTKDWALLQCEARGDPLPTVEWKDSDNNTLHAVKPQISERGGRSYITVKILVTKNDNYRCVATQKEISHQISAETSVHIQGAAPEPIIRRPHDTQYWSLLQCEAHGVPPLTVEWKDSAGKTLHVDERQVSERGGRSYITVKITVTKTDTYRCVATQKEISHQISAETSVYIHGFNGWIVGFAVVILLLVVGLGYHFRDPIRQFFAEYKKESGGVELNPTGQNPTTEPLKQQGE